jgi:hypothetical protein
VPGGLVLPPRRLPTDDQEYAEMTAAATHTGPDSDLLPRAGAAEQTPAGTQHPAVTGPGRAAAICQLVIAVCYTGGVVVPALVARALPAGPGNGSVRLWSDSAGATASVMHILGFFAATVGMAVSLVCVPLCGMALAQGWRSQSVRSRVVLVAAALAGTAFLVWSATPSGRALRGFIAD